MNTLFAFGFFGTPLSYLLIGFVAFLLFGSRLPQIARSIGSSVVEFKKGCLDIKDDAKKDVEM